MSKYSLSFYNDTNTSLHRATINIIQFLIRYVGYIVGLLT